jgi:hypothetical protein
MTAHPPPPLRFDLAEVMRTHRKKVDYALVALIGVSLVVGVAKALGVGGSLSGSIAEGLTLALFAAVAFALVALIVDHRELADRVADLRGSVESTGSMVRLLDEKTGTFDRVALLLDPSKPDDYRAAWGGFTGTYRVFNPTYTAEGEAYAPEQLVRDVYVPRYSNAGLRGVEYVLFCPEGKSNFSTEYFRRLMTDTARKAPGCVERLLHLRLIKLRREELPPPYEFYLGEKDKQGVAIIDFALPPMQRMGGLPEFVFAVYNPEVLSDLKRQFYQSYGAPNALELDVTKFLDPSVPWDDLVNTATPRLA